MVSGEPVMCDEVAVALSISLLLWFGWQIRSLWLWRPSLRERRAWRLLKRTIRYSFKERGFERFVSFLLQILWPLQQNRLSLHRIVSEELRLRLLQTTLHHQSPPINIPTESTLPTPPVVLQEYLASTNSQAWHRSEAVLRRTTPLLSH